MTIIRSTTTTRWVASPSLVDLPLLPFPTPVLPPPPVTTKHQAQNRIVQHYWAAPNCHTYVVAGNATAVAAMTYIGFQSEAHDDLTNSDSRCCFVFVVCRPPFIDVWFLGPLVLANTCVSIPRLPAAANAAISLCYGSLNVSEMK